MPRRGNFTLKKPLHCQNDEMQACPASSSQSNFSPRQLERVQPREPQRRPPAPRFRACAAGPFSRGPLSSHPYLPPPRQVAIAGPWPPCVSSH